MKIKAKLPLAGDSFSAGAGEVVDVPDEIARQLIEAGVAERAEEPKGKARRAERAVRGEGERR